MIYEFKINIHPCVNFHTNSAEVYVVDHTYDGMGKGIVVKSKHIGTYNNNDEAMAKTEEFCNQLHEKLKAICIAELKNLPNAKP